MESFLHVRPIEIRHLTLHGVALLGTLLANLVHVEALVLLFDAELDAIENVTLESTCPWKPWLKSWRRELQVLVNMSPISALLMQLIKIFDYGIRELEVLAVVFHKRHRRHLLLDDIELPNAWIVNGDSWKHPDQQPVHFSARVWHYLQDQNTPYPSG
jgi:hypothetical protein